MATQKLLAPYTTGQTIVGKLYADGVLSSVIQTSSSFNEVEDNETNLVGIYEGIFIDVPAGRYQLVIFRGGLAVGIYTYNLTLSTNTFFPTQNILGNIVRTVF